jgi:hypothetical protein
MVALLGLAVGCSGTAEAGESPAERVDFQRQIRPILAARCYECHGEHEQKSSLRLDRRAAAFKGGDTAPAVVPFDSSGSLLVQYITGKNPDNILMPAKGPPLEASEVALIRAWIDQGAAWEAQAADVGEAAPAAHWAFRPVRRPAPPEVRNAAWCRNPIDRFVLDRLETERIVPAAEAERATLFRRLHLDLLGLPPSPTDLDEYEADGRQDAYERWVDRLLAAPAFGERWSRHWLDLARYADSDGYEDDKHRPDAWRYRAWVIDAYNLDLPFDEFTVQQIAGDLLEPASYEARAATGFHRMTLSNNAGAGGIAEEYRVKTVKDRANTTGTAWLGLTLGCAECHAHKYDPISQREYYQFYAFFDNVEEQTTPAPALPEPYQREYQKALRAFEERVAEARRELSRYERDVLPAKQRAWEGVASRDPGVPAEIGALLATGEDQRSEAQRMSLKKYFQEQDPEHARLKMAVLAGGELGNNRPLPPSDRALTVGTNPVPRKTFLQKRGDFLRPGAEVRPGVPGFLPPLVPRGAEADRMDLAHWLVAPVNPLTARVAVNQTWQALFGQGLCASPDNFGIKGERPVQKELLDWLASELVARRWSRKAMVRLIVTSAAYRQSSVPRPELAARDPGNALLARQNRLRVEAECVRDLALASSGLVEAATPGPSVQPPLPAAVLGSKELKNERFMEPSAGTARYRRGIYINSQRTFPYPMLATFDAADANVCSSKRDRSNTPLQALTLLNDPVFVEAAHHVARRVLREQPPDDQKRAKYLFQLCLGRLPVSDELALVEGLLREQRVLYATHARQVSGSAPTELEALEAGWTAVARAVMNLDEFITRE